MTSSHFLLFSSSVYKPTVPYLFDAWFLFTSWFFCNMTSKFYFFQHRVKWISTTSKFLRCREVELFLLCLRLESLVGLASMELPTVSTTLREGIEQLFSIVYWASKIKSSFLHNVLPVDMFIRKSLFPQCLLFVDIIVLRKTCISCQLL